MLFGAGSLSRDSIVTKQLRTMFHCTADLSKVILGIDGDGVLLNNVQYRSFAGASRQGKSVAGKELATEKLSRVGATDVDSVYRQFKAAIFGTMYGADGSKLK